MYPSIHAGTRFRRNLKYLHSRARRLDVPMCGITIKLDNPCKIRLGDDCDVCCVEDGWILQGLVITLCNRQQHNAKRFPKIVTGRANEIADVLDQENFDLL